MGRRVNRRRSAAHMRRRGETACLLAIIPDRLLRGWRGAGSNRSRSLAGQAAGVEAPERDQDAEDDRLRPRWAARDIDIDRQNLVDAAGAGVSLGGDAPGGG